MTNFFENSRTPLCVHKGLEKVVRFKEKTLYEFFHKKCDLNIRWFMKSIYEVLSDQKLSWKSWSRKLYRKNDTFCTMAAMSCFFFTFVCFQELPKKILMPKMFIAFRDPSRHIYYCANYPPVYNYIQPFAIEIIVKELNSEAKFSKHIMYYSLLSSSICIPLAVSLQPKTTWTRLLINTSLQSFR